MASGTLNFPQSASSGSYIDTKVEWTSDAYKSENYSNVTAKLYVKKGHTSQALTTATSGAWKYSLTVNGKTASGSVSKSVLTDWVLVATKTVKEISHSSDGSKSITISGSVSAPSGTSYAGHTSKGSGTATLDNIARASTITSAGDVILGNKCSVKWTPADSSFRFKLKFSMDGWSHTTGAIHPNKTTAYTYTGYTIPLEAAKQLMYAATGTMTVALYTYSDSDASKQVGSNTKTFKVTVPDTADTQPKVTMVLSPVGSLGSVFDGLYIQGKTKIKADLTATAKYDASVLDTYMKVNGVVYDSDEEYTSEYLANYGDIECHGYASDSRGYIGSTSQTITVIAYSKPQILPTTGEDEVIAGRCDADGNLLDSGTYLKIKAKRSYSPIVSDGVQHNFCRIQYRYKLSGASSYSSWNTVLDGATLDTDEIVSGALLGGVLAVDNSYLVQVRAIDDLEQYSYTTIEIPTDKVYMHRDKVRRALAIGKYIELDNCVDIAEDITLLVRGEKWVSLGLSDGVTESTSNCSRGASNTGCFYRVVNGNHVYIAFNCGFEYNGDAVTINLDTIPKELRPARYIYGLSVGGGPVIARVRITPAGNITINHAQHMTTGATTGLSVSWIDGYIDYFL